MKHILNNNVKHLAKQKGIGQKDLGEALGRNRSFINGVFQNNSSFGIDHVLKLSELFNVSVDLLRFTDLTNKSTEEIAEMSVNEPSSNYGAGIPMLNFDELTKKDFTVSEYFNLRAFKGFANSEISVYLNDNSMAPFCRQYSLVFFKEIEVGAVTPDVPCLFILKKGTPVFRYALKGKDAKHLLFRCDHPEFADEEMAVKNIEKVYQYELHISNAANYIPADNKKLVELQAKHIELQEKYSELLAKK